MILFVAGILLGGLISWFITYRYYVKAGADQREELEKLSSKLKPRTTLEDFERLVDSAKWHKVHIDNREVWVCDEDNTFQIHEGSRSRDFSELWTAVHPDITASTCPVYLKIASTTIKELLFVVADGGRIFVPITERRPAADGELEYFWNIDGLAAKVCRIVGRYYIYNSLEGVAKRSKVAIVGGDREIGPHQTVRSN